MAKKITNKEIVAQIRDLNQSITTFGELQRIGNEQQKKSDEVVREHIKSDLLYQEEDKKWKKRAEPMVQAFEENKIVKIRFKKDSTTVFFYAGGILAVGGAWYLVKTFILKLFGI